MAKRSKVVRIDRPQSAREGTKRAEPLAAKSGRLISLKRLKAAAARAEQRGDVHVVPFEGGWTVRREGTVKEGARFANQREAIESARLSAKKRGSDLVVHGRNGRIRSKDSYGSDPLAPRDRKQ